MPLEVSDTTTAPAAAPAPAVTTSPATAPAAASAPSAAAVLGEQTPVAAVTPAAPSLPGKDAKPEDWTKFYDGINAPKDAAAYELPVPEGIDPTFSKTATIWMAEQRLLPEQAKGLASSWNAFVAEQKATAEAQSKAKETDRITALNAKNTAEEASLKNEWGQSHEVEMAHASRGAQQFIKPIAGDKSADVIVAIENVIGYAATVKFLHSLGKGIGEATARGLGGGPASTGGQSIADRLYPSAAKT